MLIQAFRIRCVDDLKRAMESEADYLLLDNGTGTGEAFDWSLISDAEELMCGEAARPWILAGGLGPDNVAEAVRRFRPYAVDLSSGAETDGWKDPEKMARCVQAVREAGREGGSQMNRQRNDSAGRLRCPEADLENSAVSMFRRH